MFVLSSQKSKPFRCNFPVLQNKLSDLLNSISEVDSQRWLEASQYRDEFNQQSNMKVSDENENAQLSIQSVNDVNDSIIENFKV